LKRTSGRNIFVIDLKKVFGSSTPAAFAKNGKDARMRHSPQGQQQGLEVFIKQVQDFDDDLEPVESALIAHNEKGHHEVKKPA